MTNVPTGGRKTTLKVSIAAMEIVTATHSGELAATSRTTSSNAVATVVALAPGSQREKIAATAAIAANPAVSRAASDGPRVMRKS